MSLYRSPFMTFNDTSVDTIKRHTWMTFNRIIKTIYDGATFTKLNSDSFRSLSHTIDVGNIYSPSENVEPVEYRHMYKNVLKIMSMATHYNLNARRASSRSSILSRMQCIRKSTINAISISLDTSQDSLDYLSTLPLHSVMFSNYTNYNIFIDVPYLPIATYFEVNSTLMSDIEGLHNLPKVRTMHLVQCTLDPAIFYNVTHDLDKLTLDACESNTDRRIDLSTLRITELHVFNTILNLPLLPKTLRVLTLSGPYGHEAIHIVVDSLKDSNIDDLAIETSEPFSYNNLVGLNWNKIKSIYVGQTHDSEFIIDGPQLGEGTLIDKYADKFMKTDE